MQKNSDFKYQVGQTIDDGKRHLKIIDKTKIDGKNHAVKGYVYECQNCGNIDKINEYNLNNGNGCNVCCVSPTKIVRDINSIWKTNPEYLRYFKNKEDSFRISRQSHKKMPLICPNCGYQRTNLSIYTLTNHGFRCPRCSDSFPFTEKFVFNALEQVGAEFQFHKKFDWSNSKSYDFFLHKNMAIIETNGQQHYEGGFSFRYSKSKTLEREKENDLAKKTLAQSNGINHYIVIDCSKSERDYITNSILNSELSNLFDFTNVDWTKCEKFAFNSLVKTACNLFSSGINIIPQIANKMNISGTTVRKYLKLGNTLGWCIYDPKVCIAESNRRNAPMKHKKVICVTTGKIFDSMSSAAQYGEVSISKVSSCCSGIQNYAGKLPDNTPLVWLYYDDFTKMSNEDIASRIARIRNSTRKVQCITTSCKFDSIKEAAKKYNCNPSNIGKCCKGQFKTAGKNLITGEPLKWRYI